MSFEAELFKKNKNKIKKYHSTFSKVFSLGVFMDFLQSKEHYRFSSDALLLADFASTHLSINIFDKKRGIKVPFLFIDLGCGCGVVGIQILKYIETHYPHYIKDTYVLGLDRESELIVNANINAHTFGFCDNYHAICADISHEDCHELVQNWAFEKIEKYKGSMDHIDDGIRKNPRLFDAVMVNPPWYDGKCGRMSHGDIRRNALFGDETTMPLFLRFTEKKLKKNASLFVVGKSSNFIDCLKAVPASFACTTVQNVYAKEDADAVFFLLEARFQSKADMVFSSPLFLHKKMI